MKDKKNIRLKGPLRLYIQWPLIMIFVLVVMDVLIYRTNHREGMVMSAFLLLYIILVGVFVYQVHDHEGAGRVCSPIRNRSEYAFEGAYSVLCAFER